MQCSFVFIADSWIFQELARLDKEGRRNREELATLVQRAEELNKGVSGSLDRLADHMLSAPR